MNQELAAIIKSDQPLTVTKMNGTGNDFIVIDHRQLFIPEALHPDLARLVCRRKFSAGADGLILIENSDEADFQWQFYNADGSVAEMCGNGARCAARYAHSKAIAPAKMRFMTGAGIIEAEIIEGDTVRLQMTTPGDICQEAEVILDGSKQKISSINTGVPHAVCLVTDLDKVPVVEWGRIIRNHQLFMPAGSNVNFGEITSEHEIHLRTYERGVEDETLACGTGAVATAIMAGLSGTVVSPVSMITAGGEELTIHFSVDELGREVEQVFLEGPARFVYEGRLHPEALC